MLFPSSGATTANHLLSILQISTQFYFLREIFLGHPIWVKSSKNYLFPPEYLCNYGFIDVTIRTIISTSHQTVNSRWQGLVSFCPALCPGVQYSAWLRAEAQTIEWMNEWGIAILWIWAYPPWAGQGPMFSNSHGRWENRISYFTKSRGKKTESSKDSEPDAEISHFFPVTCTDALYFTYFCTKEVHNPLQVSSRRMAHLLSLFGNLRLYLGFLTN